MAPSTTDVDTAAELAGDEIKDRQFVIALARGLEVLRAFTPGDGLLGNQDIAGRTGLPKPTVSRLTHTLCRLGYLSYSDRLGKYHLGPGALALGYAALANVSVRQIARPHMQRLADEADASVSLGSRDRLFMLYVERCRGQATVTLRLDPGSRIPIATTAMGRALLAGMPEGERAILLDHIARQDPAAWPQTRAGIEQAVHEYRHWGFTVSAGDWQGDVHAVGVPLMAPDGSAIYALNCAGPSFLFNRTRLIEDLGPRLVTAVQHIQAELVQA